MHTKEKLICLVIRTGKQGTSVGRATSNIRPLNFYVGGGGVPFARTLRRRWLKYRLE